MLKQQAEEEKEKEDLRKKILKLSAGQQEGAFSSIATFKNASDLIKLLDKGVKTGPLTGVGTAGLEIFGVNVFPSKQHRGTSTQDENYFISGTTAFAANFIKSISGVAVSAQEYKRLMRALPSIYNQENVNRDNLKMLTDTIKNKYELQLGINFDDYPSIAPNLETIRKTENSDDLFNNLLEKYGK